MRGGNWDMRGLTEEQRFRAKFVEDSETGCWNWTAATFGGGYGVFRRDGRSQLAHRISYDLFVGPIPLGLTLDHLCRNRACVNPAHLEPVTFRENVLRGVSPAAVHARQTHCVHGHAFDDENTTYRAGRRECRACMRVFRQRYKERKADRLSTLQGHVEAGT